MIVQDFEIPKYKWKVRVYYYSSCYYAEEIISKLKSIGCEQECLNDARDSMESNQLNSGLCYSNFKNKETVIVIAKTTSTELFVNSWLHESKHLLSHIELKYNIDPYSEEAAYLCGTIGLYMYKTASRFLCKCHCKNHSINH